MQRSFSSFIICSLSWEFLNFREAVSFLYCFFLLSWVSLFWSSWSTFCEALRSVLRLPSLFRQFSQTKKQYALNVGWRHWRKESNFCWILYSSLSLVDLFTCKSTYFFLVNSYVIFLLKICNCLVQKFLSDLFRMKLSLATKSRVLREHTDQILVV